LVLGVQGMADWSPKMQGRFFDATTAAFEEDAQARWFATATGRVGYTITPAALFYVKGGAAWSNNRYQDFGVQPNFCPGSPTGCQSLQASTTVTQLGWTVGLGFEYMVTPNMSVFVEYNYLDFGTANVNFTFPPGSIPATNTFQIAQHIQTIIAGVNFRFNFGGPPVVASRY
jgi:outer membrane immunogenic protein